MNVLPLGYSKRHYDEVIPGVFSLDLYSRKDCEAMLRMIADRPADDAPNSMNKYGKVLDGAEFRKILAAIDHDVIQPIAKKHFPEINTLKKNPYGFSIDYDVKKQKSLARHFDSSDVTLNVCLGEKFVGGGLIFYTPIKNGYGEVADEVWPVVGRAIIHRGSHEHRALPLTRGTRTNLVLWCAAKKTK